MPSIFLFCFVFAKNVQGSICDICIDNNLLTHKYFAYETKELITGDTRNRGNKELSEQSNGSILQGTKIGSAKEHGQVHLNSPESGSAKQCILLQAELSNLKEVEYPPVDFNTSPAAYILNKHPRQSWSKDCSPAAYKHSTELLP